MAVDIEQIPQTYEDAVQILAAWHGSDPRRRDLRIFAFDDHDEVVRLLEVSPSHASLGETMSLGFGRGKDFGYLSEISLVSPEEWEKIQARELPLPEGWDLGKCRQVWPQ